MATDDITQLINNLDTKLQLANQATTDFREQLNARFDQFSKDMQKQAADTNMLSILITGNGTPSKGISQRLAAAESTLGIIKWLAAGTTTAAIGAYLIHLFH